MKKFSEKSFYAASFLILLVSIVLRVINLDHRPLHGDEAVNAYKLGELLEKGHFIYDPGEYHGPALYYISSLICSLTGADSFVELSESLLRIIPVIFGIALLIVCMFLRRFIGNQITLWSLLLLSVSSPVLFYSRYYIHEILFVFLVYFILLLLYYYLKNPGFGLSLILGFSIGLFIATKETWIILIISLFLSHVFLFVYHRNIYKRYIDLHIWTKLQHVALLTGTLLFTSGLLYSSFLQHPQGWIDSMNTFSFYAKSAGDHPFHIHPWYMYIRWLFFFE